MSTASFAKAKKKSTECSDPSGVRRVLTAHSLSLIALRIANASKCIRFSSCFFSLSFFISLSPPYTHTLSFFMSYTFCTFPSDFSLAFSRVSCIRSFRSKCKRCSMVQTARDRIPNLDCCRIFYLTGLLVHATSTGSPIIIFLLFVS